METHFDRMESVKCHDYAFFFFSFSDGALSLMQWNEGAEYMCVLTPDLATTFGKKTKTEDISNTSNASFN